MGDIKFNLATPKGIYWGLNKVNKLYIGETLLFPSESSEEYDIILHFDEEKVSESKPFGIKINNVEYTATTSPLQLTYENIGVSNVDEIKSYNFGDSNMYLTKVEKMPIGKGINTTENLFSNCQNVTEINIDNWDLSNVGNANSMFHNCYELTAIKQNGELLESFANTFTPNSTLRMFASCHNLTSTPSVSMLNVSNANYMFYACTSLEYIKLNGDWNYIETTENMFQDCVKLKQISLNSGNFSLNSSWTSAQQMFDGCISLEEDPLNNYYLKTNRLQNVLGMYRNCKSLRYINLFNSSYWGFGDLTLIANCFAGCEYLNEINLRYLSYASQNITNLYNLFNGCSFLQYVYFSDWQLQNVENYDGMFGGCFNLFNIDLSNANCETLDVVTNAWNNTTIGYDNIINAPNCGGGSVQTSDRLILQADEYNNSLVFFEDNDGNGTHIGINDDYNQDALFNTTFEDITNERGLNSIQKISINGNVKNVISIPYSDTLTDIEIVNNNNLVTLDFSKINLDNLYYISVSNNENLTHIDFSNWQNVSEHIRYNFYCENLNNLKTIKMLNCSDDAKQFVQDNLNNNGLYDCIIITEDNNHYITTTSSSSESSIRINSNYYTLYSPVTNIQDFGYSDLNGVDIEQMFEDNDSIYSIINTPSLNDVYNYKRLFNSCSELQFIDLTIFNLNWDKEEDVHNLFYDSYNLKWVNLSSVNFENITSVNNMFNSCTNLKWVFAYNCNDETIRKIEEAINNAQNNGYATDCILFCDQNN